MGPWMTARYDVYNRFFNDFTRMDYKPQVIRDPSLGGGGGGK